MNKARATTDLCDTCVWIRKMSPFLWANKTGTAQAYSIVLFYRAEATTKENAPWQQTTNPHILMTQRYKEVDVKA